MEAPGRSQINLEEMFVKFATEVFLYCLNLASVISFKMIGICFVLGDIIYICVFVALVFILFTVNSYMANVFV